MSEARVDLVLLEHGRRVAVHHLAEGDSGRTVLLCHPAPGAGTFDPEPEQTMARGVSVLALDRPGYGQSDPVEDGAWTMRAAADDLAAVLERMTSAPAGVAGWGAGGWVALALAAQRPELVDRVVLLGTPAPHEQVPWIPAEHQTLLDRVRGVPAAEARTALRQALAQMIPSDPRAAESLTLLAASAADETALAQPGARERLGGMLAAAFRQDAAGLAADLAGAYLEPWGFEAAAVQAKTLLLYGSRDPVAGSRHGTWWQKHLPHARVEVVPGAGHLLILTMWSRALSHLAPGHKRRA